MTTDTIKHQPASNDTTPPRTDSTHALELTNFFLADVQTGLGPFLAAYLASAGWNPGRVGMVLTLGGVVTVALQTPAGAIVDRIRAKRTILFVGIAVLACGALLLAASTAPWAVYLAQSLIGGAAPFLAPTLAAITLGLVGQRGFDQQFGKNQAFNSAGNVACALLIAAVSLHFGNRAIFFIAAVLTLPTAASIVRIKAEDIDHSLARGGLPRGEKQENAHSARALFKDRTLIAFLACAFLFHFANAAMLPQLGEMLSQDSVRSAAQFMSACIIIAQIVIMLTASFIGKFANAHGRKPLLLLAFGVLPLRALLYSLTHWNVALLAIQALDGLANAIFGVVAVLVIADRTRGTGRFNLVQGALATAVGLGAALSTTFGGKLIQHYNYAVSFLSLGTVASIAFALLLFTVPETLHRSDGILGSSQGEHA